MRAFDIAERSCLIDLSSGTFRPDAPDLAALRWQTTTIKQNAAAACLASWGVVTVDHETRAYRLTPEGIARAHITAREDRTA